MCDFQLCLVLQLHAPVQVRTFASWALGEVVMLPKETGGTVSGEVLKTPEASKHH